MPTTRPSTRLLLAEGDRLRLLALRRSVRAIAHTYGCTSFRLAERRLRAIVPELLVANVRLGAYNGIQLVHLAEPPTRSIVYMADPIDPFLLGEAQSLGAFIETLPRLPSALPSYVGATLPPHDRRDIRRIDRRSLPRGGRRAADSNTMVA
jgi:hypothetical protein